MRPRTRWILLGVSAVLLAGYAAAGFFIVPRVARTQIEAFVVETLHRRIALGKIGFNPFTLEANIADLKLTEADGAPLVAFRHLRVNAELASLWRRGVVLKGLELVAPEVDVIIGPDGRVNLARLPPPAGPPPPDKPKADERPLPVHIRALAIIDGRVGFEDRTHTRPFSAAITPIRFSLTDFRSDVGHRNAYSFSGRTRAAERLEWSGTFTVQPLGSSGPFSLADLRVPPPHPVPRDRAALGQRAGSRARGARRLGPRPGGHSADPARWPRVFPVAPRRGREASRGARRTRGSRARERRQHQPRAPGQGPTLLNA